MSEETTVKTLRTSTNVKLQCQRLRKNLISNFWRAYVLKTEGLFTLIIGDAIIYITLRYNIFKVGLLV